MSTTPSTSPDLQSLAACPVCRSPLSSLASCGSCDAQFSEVDGTPNLIPAEAERKFELSFDIRRSTVSEEEVQAVLRYPPKHGESADGPHRMDLAFVEVINGLPKGSRVLEIGCGGGQLREWLSSRGYEYVGTDISKTRIEEWLQAFGGPDVLCDAHFLPFRDEQFDLVYSSAVNEHLACPQLATNETLRVLKPGGCFVGSGSFLEPWHDDSFFHMSPLGVLQVLRMSGFDIEYIWPGWNGYRAIMDMGSRHTSKVTFLGDVMHGYYRAGNTLRDTVKRMVGRDVRPKILDDARVGGAMDWIARRPSA
jgi:SAM-dependent methyltransferase